jgi:hypothetical protein
MKKAEPTFLSIAVVRISTKGTSSLKMRKCYLRKRYSILSADTALFDAAAAARTQAGICEVMRAAIDGDSGPSRSCAIM